MATRSNYSLKEWQTLQFAPFWIFTGIAAIDGDIDKGEMAAFAKELADALLYKNPLVQEILLSVVSDMESIMKKYRDDSRQVTDGLRDVADLVERKLDAAAAKEFKMTLLFMAKKIAEASGGGPLGTGDRVSDKEKASMVLMAQALRAL